MNQDAILSLRQARVYERASPLNSEEEDWSREERGEESEEKEQKKRDAFLLLALPPAPCPEGPLPGQSPRRPSDSLLYSSLRSLRAPDTAENSTFSSERQPRRRRRETKTFQSRIEKRVMRPEVAERQEGKRRRRRRGREAQIVMSCFSLLAKESLIPLIAFSVNCWTVSCAPPRRRKPHTRRESSHTTTSMPASCMYTASYTRRCTRIHLLT